MEKKPLRDDLMGRDDHEYTEEEEAALGEDDYNENDYGGSSVSTSSLLGSPTRPLMGGRDDPNGHSNAQKRIMERQRRARIEEMEQERRRHRAHMFVPPGKRTGNGIDTPALFTCRNCGCRDTHMKKCGGGCKGHYLCSELCLHDDWNAGGHKKVCLRGGQAGV